MSDGTRQTTIDPEKDNVMNVRTACRAGWKVLRAVGVLRGETGQGTPYADFRVVCLKDLRDPKKEGKYREDPQTDAGFTARLKFHDSPRAIGRVGNFAKNAMEHTKPFGFHPYTPEGAAEPLDELAELVFSRPFIGKIKVDIAQDGKEYPEVEEWRAFKGEADPAWEGIFNTACDGWEEFLRERAERAERQAERGDQGGGGRRGGGRGKGGGPDVGF
jgi:hypothetical protein